MNKVAVMTDTISLMSQEIADKHDIKIAPMGIIVEGQTYPENEVDLAEFYEKLPKWKEAGNLPTSSSIPIGTFLEAYRELSQKAEAILYIGHSAKFGMSLNAALQAKKRRLRLSYPKLPLRSLILSLSVAPRCLLSWKSPEPLAPAKASTR